MTTYTQCISDNRTSCIIKLMYRCLVVLLWSSWFMQTVLKQGETGNTMYIIKEGEFDVIKETPGSGPRYTYIFLSCISTHQVYQSVIVACALSMLKQRLCSVATCFSLVYLYRYWLARCVVTHTPVQRAPSY